MDKEHSKVTIVSDEAKEEKNISCPSCKYRGLSYLLYLNGNPEELPIIDDDFHVTLIDGDNLTIEVMIFDKS